MASERATALADVKTGRVAFPIRPYAVFRSEKDTKIKYLRLKLFLKQKKHRFVRRRIFHHINLSKNQG